MSLAMVVLYDMRNFELEDTTMKIEMEPIGYVRNKVKDRKDVSWGEDTSSGWNFFTAWKR